MKLSPTLTLALVLAAGMAGGGMAQSTVTTGAVPNNPQPAAQNVQAGWQPGQAHPSFTQPQADIGQTAAAADDRVRQAQQQLQSAGLYNGPVDGVMDPDTRAALARFQQENGLRRTQDLDQATMSRLTTSHTAGSGTSTATTPTPTPNAGPRTTAPATGAGGNAAGQPTGR